MYCKNCGTNMENYKFCPACGSEANINESNQDNERILEDLTLNDVHFLEENAFSYTNEGAVFNYRNAGCNFIIDKNANLFKILSKIFIIFFISLFILIPLMAIIGNNESNCIFPILMFLVIILGNIFIFGFIGFTI